MRISGFHIHIDNSHSERYRTIVANRANAKKMYYSLPRKLLNNPELAKTLILKNVYTYECLDWRLQHNREIVKLAAAIGGVAMLKIFPAHLASDRSIVKLAIHSTTNLYL